MDRRDFLKLSAGAAIAAALPGTNGAARQADPGRQFETFMRDMQNRMRSMRPQPPFNFPPSSPPFAPPPPQRSYTAPPATYDEYDFVLARVRFKEQGKGPDVWNVRPGGDANLLRELSATIRCKVKPIQTAFDWNPQYATDGQLNAIVTFDDPSRSASIPSSS